MPCSWWLVGLLAFPLQVPSPTSGAEAARKLDEARRSILAREARELHDLAEELAQTGDARGGEQVRARLPQPARSDGATRFRPLPDRVERRAASQAEPWRVRADEIQSRSASERFELAGRAARGIPARWALASQCLREVVERQPDHREARRLLGFVPYEGGWARPFVVHQLEEGYVNHSRFGWVRMDWVPHLERGEL